MDNKINLNEIVKIEQMPKVFEQLELVGEFLAEQLKDIDKLECTEENKQLVKNKRTEINNTLKILEDKRKEIKTKINEPYDLFDKKYKETAKIQLEEASQTLTNKINKIEDEQKLRKKEKVQKYFNEYAKFKNIDFVNFEQVGLNITLSISDIKLQEQTKEFLDKVADDLILIDSQEFKDEILIEYKKTLNASASITLVINRHKELEELKKKEEAKKVVAEQIKENVEKVEKVLSVPVKQEIEMPTEEILEMSFKVKGTLKQLKEIKTFLETGGYDYE